MDKNEYESLGEAVKSWESDAWKNERTMKLDAAVCYTVADKYFIVVHKQCVDYRLRKSQIVNMLHMSTILPDYIRKVLEPRSEIFD